MTANQLETTILGRHDFNWLRAQPIDDPTAEYVEHIIVIEEAFRAGNPLRVSDEYAELHFAGGNVITRDDRTHGIAHGYTQIFQCLDRVLPDSFRHPTAGALIDVGANEGHWTMYMKRLFPDAATLAVEPNPHALDLLERNMGVNALHNVEIARSAIGDTTEKRVFSIIPAVTTLGGFAISKTGRGWLTDNMIEKIEVPTDTIDNLVADVGRVAILKIDVEGAELEALAGANRTLDYTDKVQIEYNTDRDRVKLIALLEEKGFGLLYDDVFCPGAGDLFFSRHDSA
jgi:FkbM family methyltransferase